MQKITPFLWFDNQAEEAAKFYVSVFKNSQIITIARYGEGGPGPKGSVMTVAFELEGQKFTALNGGPMFKFNESISFVINCQTQEEIDYYWAKLLEGGGKESQCGWLKDKFGLSWQIVPTALMEMLEKADGAQADRLMKAVMESVKFDIATLKKAYAGG
jgi:Uncharacterized protein conserved in bacteria